MEGRAQVVDLGGHNSEDHVWVWSTSWWVGACWDGGSNKGSVGSVEDVRRMVSLESMIHVLLPKKRIHTSVPSRATQTYMIEAVCRSARRYRMVAGIG
jgi:hypothetical protein